MPYKYSRRNLYFAVFVANLLFITSGCAMTWPSPAVPLLKQWPGLSPSDESWLGSIVTIGAAAGLVLYGLGIDLLGRRGTLVANGIVYVISWVALAFGRKIFALLCIGRFIAGIGAGAALAAVPVYISEITDDDSRQVLTSLIEFFYALGFLVTYSIGPFVPYGWIAGADSVPVLIFLLAVPLIPESPYHQVATGCTLSARKTLVWLRRSNDVDWELARIQREVRESRENHGKLRDLFNHRGPRLAFFFGLFIMCLQQLSAIDVVITFAEPLFNASAVSLSPTACTLILGGINIIFAAASIPVIAVFGSKVVLIISTCINASGLLVFGIYMSLGVENSLPENDALRLLPLIGLICVTTGYALGFGSIPCAIIAGLFPLPLKAVALLTISSLSWIFDFIVMEAFGVLVSNIGAGPIFIFYGVCVAIGTGIIFLLLPKTKGLPLSEINSIFDKKCEGQVQPSDDVSKKF